MRRAHSVTNWLGALGLVCLSGIVIIGIQGGQVPDSLTVTVGVVAGALGKALTDNVATKKDEE